MKKMYVPQEQALLETTWRLKKEIRKEVVQLVKVVLFLLYLNLFFLCYSKNKMYSGVLVCSYTICSQVNLESIWAFRMNIRVLWNICKK